MMQITITAKGKQQLSEAILKACWEIADRIYSEATLNLTGREWPMMGANGAISTHITDTGELAASGSVERTKDGARVVFGAEYASYVEYGIAPGGFGPPAEILAEWCVRKLGVPKKDALGIAWAIKQKIREEGTIARPFFREAVYKTIAEYENKKVKV